MTPPPPPPHTHTQSQNRSYLWPNDKRMHSARGDHDSWILQWKKVSDSRQPLLQFTQLVNVLGTYENQCNRLTMNYSKRIHTKRSNLHQAPLAEWTSKCRKSLRAGGGGWKNKTIQQHMAEHGRSCKWTLWQVLGPCAWAESAAHQDASSSKLRSDCMHQWQWLV